MIGLLAQMRSPVFNTCSTRQRTSPLNRVKRENPLPGGLGGTEVSKYDRRLLQAILAPLREIWRWSCHGYEAMTLFRKLFQNSLS
jgi:hypothetical protein